MANLFVVLTILGGGYFFSDLVSDKIISFTENTQLIWEDGTISEYSKDLDVLKKNDAILENEIYSNSDSDSDIINFNVEEEVESSPTDNDILENEIYSNSDSDSDIINFSVGEEVESSPTDNSEYIKYKVE